MKTLGRPFAKGVSGNPGGRPKELREIVELARSYAPEAIETLALIMANPEAPPAARVAANAILDRGFGKPTQPVEAEASGGFSLATLVNLSIQHQAEMKAKQVDAMPSNE